MRPVDARAAPKRHSPFPIKSPKLGFTAFIFGEVAAPETKVPIRAVGCLNLFMIDLPIMRAIQKIKEGASGPNRLP